MKKILFLVVFSILFLPVTAQKTYTIDDTSYELKTEVSGTIDLLWNIIDSKYRYFIKKDNVIVELTNTKNGTKTYQEEYKTILEKFTSDEIVPTENVKLTLPSLAKFINNYNALKSKDYVIEDKRGKVNTRFAIFGGITNNPFVINPENTINPVFGLEIEVFEANKLPSHSIYLKGRQVIGNKEFDYYATQIAIGYRFRFIKSAKLSIYTNVDLAQYSFTKQTKTIFNDDYHNEVVEKNNGFEVPFIFGLGAEYKLTDNTFLTLTYNEIFALLLGGQDNFSKSFALGVRINL